MLVSIIMQQIGFWSTDPRNRIIGSSSQFKPVLQWGMQIFMGGAGWSGVRANPKFLKTI